MKVFAGARCLKCGGSVIVDEGVEERLHPYCLSCSRPADNLTVMVSVGLFMRQGWTVRVHNHPKTRARWLHFSLS